MLTQSWLDRAAGVVSTYIDTSFIWEVRFEHSSHNHS